jgi:hypothetical protein
MNRGCYRNPGTVLTAL